MTPKEISRLRVFYHSLRGQLRVLEASSDKQYQLIKEPSLITLEAEINDIQNEFPGIIPKFDKQQYFSRAGRSYRLYHATGILGVIEMVLARLEAVIDESKGTPVTETREFRFIAEGKLRVIL